MFGKFSRSHIVALVLGVAACVLAGFANADPPGRVARLSYASGTVSFSPAGEDDWLLAMVNRPLIPGDRLWTDVDARTEMQVGSATIRMNSATLVSLVNLDDRVAQVQLTQGTLDVRVRRFSADDVIEVDTPNLAYSIRQPGEYRIEVDPGGNSTTVVLRDGQAEVYGQGVAYTLYAGQAYRFIGPDLRNYDYIDFPPFDEFDMWSSDRNRREDESISARYVSPNVIGYEDMDQYGKWYTDREYGIVWVPNVPYGWSPYSEGHWAWIEPWGWTWIDDAPWGFAVSHYGRWVNIEGRWCWMPGPVQAQAVYAPALVAFVGDQRGGVAWFPLGPREVYRPAYPVSRNYFTRINSSNTVVNNTNITKMYNNANETNVAYANSHVQGAVISVSLTAFIQSHPVSGEAVRLPKETIANAPVRTWASVSPTRASVGGAAKEGHNPSRQIQERPFVARNAPPEPPLSFAAKEHLLASRQGKPLDVAELQALKRGNPAPEMKVQLVPPTQVAAPLATRPAQRGKFDQPGPSDQRGQAFQPNVRPQSIAPAISPLDQPRQPQQSRQPQAPDSKSVTPFNAPQNGAGNNPEAVKRSAPAIPPLDQPKQLQQSRQPQAPDSKSVTPFNAPQNGAGNNPEAVKHSAPAISPLDQPKQLQQNRQTEMLPGTRPATPPSAPGVARDQSEQRGQFQHAPDSTSATPFNARQSGMEKKPEAVKREEDGAAKERSEKLKVEEEKKKDESSSRKDEER